MADGSIYRLAIEATVTIQDVFVNVLHYRQSGANPPGLSGAQACAEGWIAEVLPDYQDLSFVGTQFLVVEVNQVVGGIEQATIGLTNVNGVRVGTSDFLPGQTAAVVSWKSGLRGRSFNGRSFIFPTREEDQGAGEWTPEYQALIQTYADNAREFVYPGGSPQFFLGTWSTTLSQFSDTVEGIVRTSVFTQRRRRFGQGS